MISFFEMRATARQALKGRWNESALAALPLVVVTCVMVCVNLFIAGTGISIWSEMTNSVILFLLSVLLIAPLAWGLMVAMWHIVQGNRTPAIQLLGDSFKNDWVFAVKFCLYIMVFVILYYFLFIFGASVVLGIGLAKSGIDANSLIGLNEIQIMEILQAQAPSIGYGFLAVLLLFMAVVIRLQLMYCLTYFVHIDQPNLSTWAAMQESKRLINGHKWQGLGLQLTFIGWTCVVILTLGIGLLWLQPYLSATMAVFYEELRAEDIGYQEEEIIDSIEEEE